MVVHPDIAFKHVSLLQAKGKTVMYLPAEMMEIGETSVAAKDKVSVGLRRTSFRKADSSTPWQIYVQKWTQAGRARSSTGFVNGCKRVLTAVLALCCQAAGCTNQRS